MRYRLTCWPERLAALVEERRSVPFTWGEHDCVSFAADAAQAVTGADPIAPWRGSYASEEEGDRILGPDGLEAFVARFLADFGAREIPPARAQRGDWVLLTIGNQALCGVCLGATIAAPGQRGLAFVPARKAVRAWAV
jgi:hypothetical protein